MEHSEENNKKHLISHKTRIIDNGICFSRHFWNFALIGIIPRLIQDKEVAAETKPLFRLFIP